MDEARSAEGSFWNLYSLIYDSVSSFLPYQRLLESVLDALELAPGARVLDMGCGTGNVVREIVSRQEAVEVTGVDSSPAMLSRARRKCAPWPNAHFLQADLAEPLPFSGASFDAIVVSNVLYSVEDRAHVAAEVERLLVPGGRLVLSDPKPDARPAGLLASHFAEIRRLPLGRRFAEYAKSLVTIPLTGTAMMLVNLVVVLGRERRGEYHFSTEAELCDLLGWADLRPIGSSYGGQNWFVVADKPHGGQPDDE